MPRPLSGAGSYASQALANGDAAVVSVSEVVDGSIDGLDQAALDEERRNLKQAIAGTYYDQLLADLESRSRIERKQLGDQASE